MSTDELGQGPLWEKGHMMLGTFFAKGAVPSDFPPRDELDPIAVGAESGDLHVMWMGGPTTENGHPILWLAGEEIDRWSHFGEYFRSMHAYNERLVERARARR